MPTDPRITPDEVIAAYKATGLVPIREEYCRREGRVLCGCPLTALYLVVFRPRILRVKSINLIAGVWAEDKYGSTYVSAFTGAFDRPNRRCHGVDGRYVAGHVDGNAVAAAVSAEFAEVLGA